MNAVYDLANGLLSTLAPACERIEIAGSIRRGKPAPKDVEICAISRITHNIQAGLFGDTQNVAMVNQLEDLIEILINSEGWEWEFDPVTVRDGSKYKRLRHRSALNHLGNPVCCDLFIPNARTWGVIFAIRTGPDEFSKGVVSLAHRKGMFADKGLLHRHRRQYDRNNKPRPCQKGDACSLIVPTPEEEDFFAALGLPCWPPAERSLSRLMDELRA